MIHPRGIWLLLPLFAAGCATTPLVIDPTHPASPDAPEASTRPARTTLQPDAATRQTRELLAQREQQAKAAEAEKPVDQPTTNPGTPKPMEGHEHH